MIMNLCMMLQKTFETLPRTKRAWSTEMKVCLDGRKNSSIADVGWQSGDHTPLLRLKPDMLRCSDDQRTIKALLVRPAWFFSFSCNNEQKKELRKGLNTMQDLTNESHPGLDMNAALKTHLGLSSFDAMPSVSSSQISQFALHAFAHREAFTNAFARCRVCRGVRRFLFFDLSIRLS
jgi:hypothetical protein